MLGRVDVVLSSSHHNESSLLGVLSLLKSSLVSSDALSVTLPCIIATWENRTEIDLSKFVNQSCYDDV